MNMSDCQLVSNDRIAKRVNASGKKDVCGWINCQWINVDPAGESVDDLPRVWYNPIVDTEWHMHGVDAPVTWWKFRRLTTNGRRVYCRNL